MLLSLEFLEMARQGIIETDIKNRFSLYEKLLQESKIIKKSNIEVNQTKANNIHYLENKSDVSHKTIVENITLSVIAKTTNYNYFQFQLRCSEIFDKPFFRFDSDGSAHRNYNVEILFSEQMVTTPHFNKFDREGRNVAYKTDKLINKNECAALLGDISLSMIHFCHESALRTNDDNFPNIILMSNDLNLKQINEDPLTSVTFL